MTDIVDRTDLELPRRQGGLRREVQRHGTSAYAESLLLHSQHEDVADGGSESCSTSFATISVTRKTLLVMGYGGIMRSQRSPIIWNKKELLRICSGHQLDPELPLLKRKSKLSRKPDFLRAVRAFRY